MTNIVNFFSNLNETYIFIGLILALIINNINYITTMLKLGSSLEPKYRDKCVIKIYALIIIQLILVTIFLKLFTNTGTIDLLINNFITNIFLLSIPFAISLIFH